MKEQYVRTVVEIIDFKNDDVILSSGCGTGPDETPEDIV